jgi:hypothetical protein
MANEYFLIPNAFEDHKARRNNPYRRVLLGSAELPSAPCNHFSSFFRRERE